MRCCGNHLAREKKTGPVMQRSAVAGLDKWKPRAARKTQLHATLLNEASPHQHHQHQCIWFLA